MEGTAIHPAAQHLFDVNDEGVKLDKATAELFHHNVAKLLFLSKRARPDIQPAVAFLCTRVQCPDVDDYKKLARVMRYLRDRVFGRRNDYMSLCPSLSSLSSSHCGE
jgi:hypothetical protein